MDAHIPIPVLFRREPVISINQTEVGIRTGIKGRRPLRHRRPDILARLMRGPFLAAFDAGLDGQYIIGASLWSIARAIRGAR